VSNDTGYQEAYKDRGSGNKDKAKAICGCIDANIAS